MTVFVKIIKPIIVWIVSSLMAIIIGVTAQTQFILNRYSQLGIDISFQDRLSTTVYDIQHLGSVYGLFLSIALAIAFLASGTLFHFTKKYRSIIYAVAGGVAILVLLFSMKAAFFNIHMINGARDFFGITFQFLAGILAGYIFSKLTFKRHK